MKDIIAEFRKKFLTPAGHYRYLRNGTYDTAVSELEVFILKALQSQREEIIEMIEEENKSNGYDTCGKVLQALKEKK